MKVDHNVPDWMRCINCMVFAKNGVIKHAFGCPEHVRPRRSSTSVLLGDVLHRRR